MGKNRFVIGALVTIITLVFFLGCGGGGDDDNNTITANHEYVTENAQLNTDELNAWSDNGSVWRTESKEGDVFQDGKAENFQLEWSFPIKTGDQLSFSFDGKVTGGGEALVRIVSKIDGKTKTIYAEQKFSFGSGKNTIPTLTVANTDNQAKFIMMLGKKAGRYQFLTQISIIRKRIKTGMPQVIILDIGKGKFGSDSGSTRNSSGAFIIKAGSQRASSKLVLEEEISFQVGMISRIIITGHSLPAGNIILQLRSSNDKPLGEKTVELYGEKIVSEIISLGTAKGHPRILFPDAGEYHLEYLGVEPES